MWPDHNEKQKVEEVGNVVGVNAFALHFNLDEF